MDTINIYKTIRKKLLKKIESALINRNNNTIIRAKIKIQEIDPINWLYVQNNKVKIYWSNRTHTEEIAGIGEAFSIHFEQDLKYNKLKDLVKTKLNHEYPDLRFYGGISFNCKDVPENWRDFGCCRFIIPKFEVIRNDKHFFIAYNFCVDTSLEKKYLLNNLLSDLLDNLKSEINNLIFEEVKIPVIKSSIIKREDLPEKDKWEENISKLLAEIKNNKIKKVVLARESTIGTDNKIDPISLFRSLKKKAPNTIHFYFQFTNESAFLGASPELLYSRKNREIKCEAIAGTRKRGKTEQEDLLLESELINSDKEKNEHEFVCESIKNTLKSCCETISKNEKLSNMKLATVQHLYTPFSGKLHNDITDTELLQMLHPTPAVGGTPKLKALEKIALLENFNRGWYAGPIGYFGIKKSEFAVAIRSCLLKENKLYIYSGAGIVNGSDAEKEWIELENKIVLLLGLVKSNE